MNKYRVLVITDHNTHGKGESIYDLLRTMAKFPECEKIFLATRGNPNNNAFFTDFNTFTIHAKCVDEALSYSSDGKWFAKSESVNIADFDVLFLRLDRPLTDNQLLQISHNFRNLLIVNHPNGIIETGSKKFLLNFANLCPEMALCNNIVEVNHQLNLYPLVLKPIHGYGGIGILRLDKQNVFIGDQIYDYTEGIKIVEQYLDQQGEMLSMRYLKDVDQGDKRVLVVNGEVLGATLRLPAKGSWLCNLKQGGTALFADVDDIEYRIAETISPILKEKGVVIFGFDTLVGDDGVRKLSEINTLNVGGFLQAQQFSGKPIIENTSRLIWQYIREAGC